jgi:hypothetical protein
VTARPPWHGQWAVFPHPSFNIGGCEVMWVFCAFAYYDWCLIDINSGFPWQGTEPPPTPPDVSFLEWSKNSRRWRAWNNDA